MKKIITLFLLLVLIFPSAKLLAQNPHPFELGFNAGASWLKSDVKMKKLGGGWGLTFGQTYCMNQTSPLMWGWRLRYLNANTYGQGLVRNEGIANNGLLNGTRDTILDYNSNLGYVYDNYKTHIDELSLEVLIGANKMREKTNFYPYIFGGVGLTKAVAKTDQLNANGLRYDYAAIDSNGTSGRGLVASRLGDMYDGSYESLADGNASPRWKFMPSLGVGLGYEVVKGFSIGLEHKVTWGLNDVLDGQQWSRENTPTSSNDKYHYSSIWLKFSFGRGVKTSTNNNTTTTNITTTNNTPAVAPVVTFSNPAVPGTTITQQNTAISGKITDINSISDMSMTLNGMPVTGYTYNSSTDVFTYPANLIAGANTVVVTATNTSGTGTSTTTIIYNQPVVVALPPAITITYPNANPFTTNIGTVSVTGKVQQITSQSQMQVMVNGMPNNTFSYNSSSHAFNITSNLIQGANTFVVTATNSVGSDSKTITVIYQQPVVSTTPPPFVTIVNPAVNPYNTTMNTASITATVMNVSGIGQITATLNGGPVPTAALNYNPGTHQLIFNVNLIAGANTIVVGATNVAGADSKTETIIYTAPVVINRPMVTITNPASNPFNTAVNTATVNATITNITSVGQISVTLNGGPVPTAALNYNAASQQLMFNVNLIVGANTIVVGATNVAGADSKTETIIYTQPVVAQPPVVNITIPNVNPFNTSINTATVNATVLNVTSAGQITVTFNGSATSAFAFNPSTKQLSFNANLIPGANTVLIAASNATGSDSKTETIIYTVPVVVPAPVVTITNPNSNPFNTSSNTTVINATVLNVTSAAQISVTLNGVSTTGFAFNASSQQLNFNANLIAGANNVVITATNASGNDSKTETIIYTAPLLVAAPVVTIFDPSTNPFTTTVNTHAVNATVSNVFAAGQITVTLNGIVTTAFTYNVPSHLLVLNANLISGTNTIVISATNEGGSDSKTQTIIYNAPPVVVAPVVSFTNPTANPFGTTNATQAVVAKVLNVTTASQITVKVNGTVLPTFGFLAVTKKVSFTANLIEGNNTIIVTGTNSAGSGSKTLIINYTKPLVPVGTDTMPTNDPSPVGPARPTGTSGGATLAGSGLPVITLVTPSTTSITSSDAVYNVLVKIEGIIKAASVVVKVNGVIFPGIDYNSTAKMLSFPVNLVVGPNVIVIEATNPKGIKTETLNITKMR